MSYQPTDRTLAICARFRSSIDAGEPERDVIGFLAADYGVQRPAIWKALRAGGVIPPYRSRTEGGRGRPVGGGEPGYSKERRQQAMAARLEREARMPPRVERDPCPRCGVRGDVGCAHGGTHLGVSFG